MLQAAAAESGGFIKGDDSLDAPTVATRIAALLNGVSEPRLLTGDVHLAYQQLQRPLLIKEWRWG